MSFRSKLSTLAFILLGSALSGCSSDDSGTAPAPSYSCSAKGPCQNDAVPTSAEVASCQSLQSDATCGAAFNAYAMCAYAAAKCTDAGISDPTGDSTSTECNSEYATYTTCLGSKMNDAGN